MKWAFLLDSPDISGGSYVVFQHALHAMAAGDEVCVITDKLVNLKQLYWHPEAKALNWLTLDQACASEFDVVVATRWTTVFLLHKIPAKCYVYFVQSIESRFFPEKERPARMLADSTYVLPLEIITEAKWIQGHLLTNFNRMARLVQNGIRKDIYTESGYAHAPRQPETLRILVEGPLNIPFKNVDRTIEICRRSKADEIWLLTSTHLSRYPGVDRVFSRIPIHETAAVYRSCDIIVKLSFVEGMFGPPLELFHCGGTAIVYDVTGSDEYIRHGFNALVAQSGSEQQVIEYINTIKDQPQQLASLKEGAAITASLWPDWNHSSAEFRRAIEEIHAARTSDRQNLKTACRCFQQFHDLAEGYRQHVEGRDVIRKLRDLVRSKAPQMYGTLSRIKWFVKTRFRRVAL